MIANHIKNAKQAGADVILVSGGMSVDPDDKTPEGIRRSGAKVETHGFPVLPGSMFLMAYLGETPVMGLSGCVLHDPFTAFDALLPRLLAGEKITEPISWRWAMAAWRRNMIIEENGKSRMEN